MVGDWRGNKFARKFPRSIYVDLADREKTQALADDLIARGNVVGIVNNVGLARHERVDAVDPATFAMVMDFAKREQWYGKRGISPGIFDSMLELTTRAVGSPIRRIWLSLSTVGDRLADEFKGDVNSERHRLRPQWSFGCDRSRCCRPCYDCL